MRNTDHEKPHGTFAPKPEQGAYILREPKGIPDVLLFSAQENEDMILQAANILSVQGYTARIVLISDLDRFRLQSAEVRESVFSENISVCIGLWNTEIDMPMHAQTFPVNTTATMLAQKAMKLLIDHQ